MSDDPGEERVTSSTVVGVVPAAGLAQRLGRTPCSKEILPVGFRENDRPQVAVEHLLGAFRAAGARKAFIILREGKWDIPAYLQDGHRFGVHLAYLMMRFPFGQPYTVAAAYPFTGSATVLFGFPDILFDAQNPFVRLLERKEGSEADVVLGLFPADHPEKADMVDLDAHGRIRTIAVKPQQSPLRYTWILAVWTPTFTRFLHEYVTKRVAEMESDKVSEGPELFMGDVLRAALGTGIPMEAVSFDDARYFDIGTPGELAEAVRSNFGLQWSHRNHYAGP